MLFDSLTSKEKKLAIETAISRVKLDLYRLVNELGVDPATFNQDTFKFDLNKTDDPSYGTNKQVADSILKLKNLTKRLDEIS